MLNFGLKHRHSSGWRKKFPRQKIEREDPLHLGMHEHLRFRNEYMEGRQGYLSRKEIDNFLEANLGKNVDKVFSEFCKRAKKHKHNESLRQAFYGELDPERVWRWCYRGLYTLDAQNKIIKLKETKGVKEISAYAAQKYNEVNYPDNIVPYLNETEITYLGHFYIRTNSWKLKLTPVFICSKEWYNTTLELGTGRNYVNVASMSRVFINFTERIAKGIKKNGYSIIRVPTGKKIQGLFGEIEKYNDLRIPYTTYDNEVDYIFLAKGDEWSEY